MTGRAGAREGESARRLCDEIGGGRDSLALNGSIIRERSHRAVSREPRRPRRRASGARTPGDPMLAAGPRTARRSQSRALNGDRPALTVLHAGWPVSSKGSWPWSRPLGGRRSPQASARPSVRAATKSDPRWPTASPRCSGDDVMRTGNPRYVTVSERALRRAQGRNHEVERLRPVQRVDAKRSVCLYLLLFEARGSHQHGTSGVVLLY